MKKQLLGMVEDEKKCVEYLKRLNNIIDDLFKLDGENLNNIFNPSTNVRPSDIPNLCDMAMTLERYRNILVGDALRWKEITLLLEENING